MKKIAALLGVAFVLISACIIYLIKSGVSIRSAPIIRPSIITREQMNIAQGVVLRLTPEFQNAHFILWGLLPEQPSHRELLLLIQKEYEMLHKKPVNIIENAITATAENIRSCPQPCWLLLPTEQAHELNPNPFVQDKILPLKRPFFSITFVPFTRGVQIPENCVSQKRLTFNCLVPLAVHEAERKMKEKDKPYFFMKKYLDRDYFLFLQKQD